MPRDRWGLRKTFRTAPGRSEISWRWEVGLPLFVMGALTAMVAASANASGVIFWAGAAAAAVGASLFFTGWISR